MWHVDCMLTACGMLTISHREPYELADKNIVEMSARYVHVHACQTHVNMHMHMLLNVGRIMALAQKQKSQKEPPVTTPPQPLPPIPEASPAPLPQATPPQAMPPQTTPPARHTPRPATPLERTLLELLSDADLGATGFLKANELKAVLLKLGKVRGEGLVHMWEL